MSYAIYFLKVDLKDVLNVLFHKNFAKFDVIKKDQFTGKLLTYSSREYGYWLVLEKYIWMLYFVE